MPDLDRDKTVEQWLRQTPVPGARADDCLDAETLAAWTDGLLDGPQRATAEAHAASCARCQAMLAVMVRTTPVPAVSKVAPFRKWFMMLAPAMAAAAAVALWVAVGQNERSMSVTDVRNSQQAKIEERSAAVSAPPTAPASSAPVDKESDRKTSPDAFDRIEPKAVADAREELESRAGARRPESTFAAAEPAKERRSNERDELLKDAANAKRTDAPAASDRASAPVATPAPPPPAAAAETVQTMAGGRVVPAPPVGPAPQQQANQLPNQSQAQNQNQTPGQSQNQALPRQRAAEPPPAQVTQSAERPVTQATGDSTAAGRAAGRGGLEGGLAETSTMALRSIAVPFSVSVANSPVRWRVVDGRTVQRSLDAGATWADQYAADSSVTLTAGTAPSTNVCWLVGRSGAIVVTTDGRAWSRITFPEPADLTAVTSSDARTATVTTADGRLFGTTDGGRSWSRR